MLKDVKYHLKASSPVCTELEMLVMDWLAQMISLPKDFLHSNKQTPGGGVIQVCLKTGYIDWFKNKISKLKRIIL